jgi:glycosyltransferase involved in cell wall biosynthesis
MPISGRVGYVLKTFPRLSETFVLDEILAVEASGAEVQIFSLRPPLDGRFHRSLSELRAGVSYLPGPGVGSSVTALAALPSLGDSTDPLRRVLHFVDLLPSSAQPSTLIQGIHLAREVSEMGIGHLHAHFMTVAAHTAYIAHLLTGVSYSVTAHAKDIYRHDVDRSIFTPVARAAKAIVTVCDANRQFIRRSILPRGGTITRIYNGVPLARLDRVEPTMREANLVLGVGRLVEKKGFTHLVDAIAHLDRDDVKCVIVGEGDDRSRIEQAIQASGLTGSFVLTGAVPREAVLDLMRRARVLVAPCIEGDDGNRDALPTVLLEALALGLPVVTTPIGGIPEIVDDGVHGLLVEAGNTASLTAAIARLLDDEGLWRAMSRAGPVRARHRFDRARTVKPLLGIFGIGESP